MWNTHFLFGVWCGETVPSADILVFLAAVFAEVILMNHVTSISPLTVLLIAKEKLYSAFSAVFTSLITCPL